MHARNVTRLGRVAVLAVVMSVAAWAFPTAAAIAPVADAAKAGDLAALKRLLHEGGDVNAALGDGTTALHHAATRGDAEMVSVLLYAGANVRATTRLGGYTPLHLASQRGHEAVIERLIKGGANPNLATATAHCSLGRSLASRRRQDEPAADVDLRRDLPRRDHDVAAHGWRRADDRAGALITLEWQ